MRDPALYLLDDREEYGPPSAVSIQRLAAQGIALASIIRPWCPGVARVQFEPETRLYRPLLLGGSAFIFAVVGEDGIVDLAAWEPRTGRMATRLGKAVALGEAQISRQGLGTTGLALPVWRSPIGWLRAGRQGIVIADPLMAAHRLSGLILAGEDAAHNAELQAKLVVPPPAFTLAGEVGRYARAA